MSTTTSSPASPSFSPSSIWWLFLLQGIAGILLGAMLVSAPGVTVVALVTFLGFYWLITGVLSLVQAFVDRSSPWIWSLVSGLLGIAAGMLVLRHPLLAAVTVPTLIVIILGVEALIMGCVNVIAGFQGGGIASFIHGIQPPDRGSAAGFTDGRRAGRSVRLWRDPARAGRCTGDLGVSRPRLKN